MNQEMKAANIFEIGGTLNTMTLTFLNHDTYTLVTHFNFFLKIYFYCSFV